MIIDKVINLVVLRIIAVVWMVGEMCEAHSRMI